MSQELDFYSQQSKNLHQRFGLSNQVRFLLRKIDEVHKLHLEEYELSRIVRHSPSHRTVILETIDHLATFVTTHPRHSTDAAGLIHSLTQILKISDMASTKILPFMKLPREVRDLVYRQYLGAANRSRLEKMCYPVAKRAGCTCSFESAGMAYGRTLWTNQNMGLSQVSKTVRNEFMAVAMSEKQFYFSCTCEMVHHLRNNAIMQSSIRSIKFHWCGPQAVEAFKLLKQCRALRKLVVMPSQATTRYLTKRQQFFSRFFTQNSRLRLSDALGIDELVEIRGLTSVEAIHIPNRQGVRRSNEELANLGALLRGNLLLDKPTEYPDQDSEEQST